MTPLVRPAYFDGELLNQADLRLEQSYLREALRYHNAYLHTWGVCEGLTIEIGWNRQSVVVRKGMAIDVEGRELLLGHDQSLKLKRPLLPSYYITISYRERFQFSEVTPVPGPQYIVEDPLVEAADEIPISPEQQIILARLVVHPVNGIEAIDQSARRHASINVGRVNFVLAEHKSFDWPAIAGWEENGRYGLWIEAAHTQFSGSLAVEGNLGVGMPNPIATFGIQAKPDSGEGALPAVFLARAAEDLAKPEQWPPALTATSSLVNGRIESRVGIDVTAPKASLHIGDGDLALEGGRRVAFAGSGEIRSFDKYHRIIFQAEPPKLDVREYGEIHLNTGSEKGRLFPSVLLRQDGRVTIGTGARVNSRLAVKGIVESIAGGFMFPDGTVQTTAALSSTVPIGVVLEWWRPSLEIPVPDGFVICSEATEDPVIRPDLRHRLIRGTAVASEVGEISGEDSHSHLLTVPTHDHAMEHKHRLGGATLSTYKSTDAKYGEARPVLSWFGHTHSISAAEIPPQDKERTGKADAVTDLPTSQVINAPPYVGLLMIYRYR